MMISPEVSNSLKSISPGERAALIYDSEHQWRAAVGAFMQAGLENGDRCVYLVDPTEAGTDFFSDQSSAFCDLQSYEASGQLMMVPVAQYTTALDNPTRMVHLLNAASEQAKREGYRALRISCGMNWMVQEVLLSETFLTVASHLQEAELPDMIMLTQYDRRLTGADIVKWVVMTHNMVIWDNKCLRGLHYIPSVQAPTRASSEFEMHAWLNRMEREMEREQNRLFLAGIVEHASQPIVVVSSDGSLITCNPAFSQLTGYSQDELMSCAWDDLIPPEWAERDRLAIETMRNGKPHRYEREIYHANRSHIPVEILAHWIHDTDRGISYYYAFLTDITEREAIRSQQLELQQKLALADRLASLSTLSAGVVHEISQPLNAIKVMVDGMLYWQRQGRSPDPESFLDKLQRISAQADRITDIIAHMRSFARSGNSQDLSECCCNTAIFRAIEMVERQIADQGIQLSHRLSPTLPLIVGNPNRLEEVLINLLVNAIQAFAGTTKTDRRIELETRVEENRVVIEVSDNATGIREADLEKVFQPFFTTKRAGEGTGLGLSIVQATIASYGGTIHASNNGQGGATIRLAFPVGQPVSCQIAGRGEL